MTDVNEESDQMWRDALRANPKQPEYLGCPIFTDPHCPPEKVYIVPDPEGVPLIAIHPQTLRDMLRGDAEPLREETLREAIARFRKYRG